LKNAVSDSNVITLKGRKFKNAVLVAGLPGIGLVGKLAVDQISRSRKAERVAQLYSPHFPNQTIAMRNGKLKPFTMRFTHAKLKRGEAVFLKGDLQPMTVEGQYEVTASALGYARKIGVKRVIAMAGYAVEKIGKQPEIYCAASNPKLFRELLKKGAKRTPVKAIPIVGMAGLLPALAPAYGLEGACLLVETNGTKFDACGAKRLVEFLGGVFGEKFDVAGIDARVKKIEKAFLEMRPPQQMQPPQAEVPKGDLSYIR